MDVGARIAQLRTAYGISQYALWKRSGIAQGALSQYESGIKTPGVDTLERICDAFGISLAEFFSVGPFIPGSAITLCADEMELVGCYRMLSPEQQQDARLIFRTLSKQNQSDSTKKEL